MTIFKRIFLFSIVSILISVTISLLTRFLGFGPVLTQYGLNLSSLALYCLMWGFAGSFISLAISRWMAKFSMGVKVVDESHPNPEVRRIVTTVYEYARRAGLEKNPEVGIYESAEPNAFATGPTKNRSLVAVSTGLLQTMNRDQVDGVLAHEVAHIANGDMVTLTLIQGIVNSFVMFLARVIGYAVSTQVKEESRNTVYFITYFALDIILGILASTIVFYFSRQREYRADNGGARLAGKEKMLTALHGLLNMKNAHGRVNEGAASMQAFKISGRSSGWMSLFMTHPPLNERIARLQHSA